MTKNDASQYAKDMLSTEKQNDDGFVYNVLTGPIAVYGDPLMNFLKGLEEGVNGKITNFQLETANIFIDKQLTEEVIRENAEKYLFG